MTKKKVIILGIVAALAVLAVLFLPGYTKLQDLVAENRRLEKKIVELGDSVEELKKEKEKLEGDILYIEKVARENLGVVREDEVVIQEKP
jgi:cell division protein FtsB